MEVVTKIAPLALALIMLGLGLGLTTKDSRSTFLINRDLMTRFKVNVNPNRKFVLSHWIERSDGNDTRGVNLPLEKR